MTRFLLITTYSHRSDWYPRQDQIRHVWYFTYPMISNTKNLNHWTIFTPKEACTVRYRDVDYAVQAYLKLLDEVMAEQAVKGEDEQGNQKPKRKWKERFENHKRIKPTIYGGKSDLKSAFRILGLCRASWRWLIMKAKDPQTGIWKYFVDKCLPFGASISCSLFQKFQMPYVTL